MPQDRCGSLAFGGGPLYGSKIVRVAYLDEAGISKPAEEPYCVVAGILVNADEQWKAVERHLIEIADACNCSPRPVGAAASRLTGLTDFGLDMGLRI